MLVDRLVTCGACYWEWWTWRGRDQLVHSLWYSASHESQAAMCTNAAVKLPTS